MISRYFAFPIESIKLDTIIDFDIYLKRDNSYALYREANLPFEEKVKKKLLENNIKELYIDRSDKKKFFSYIEKNLAHILVDNTIPTRKKTEILYDTSKELIINVFENPEVGDNIKHSLNIISSTMGFILSDKSSMFYLCRVTSHDYFTYTHSLNVAIYSISLGYKLGIFSKKDIIHLGWGALLHDIGKTKVPPEIINKNGTLTDEEFAQIKKHPANGVTLLKKTGLIPDESYLPVLEHQEKGDGSGYPKGLTLKNISEFGRITAICDVFDALTAHKPYKPALSTLDALKVMSKLKNHFDPDIFKCFIYFISEK